MKKGIFITFEGIEGSGKTTQIRALAELLQSAGHKAILTREPGGCPIADKVRGVLLDADNIGMDPRTEILLFAAARAQHLADVVRPALESGHIVLCDRFSDSTFAYQVEGRGLDPAIYAAANGIATSGLVPDLTLLLDLPVEIGLARANQRNGAETKEARFELETVSYHQRVANGFAKLATNEPGRFRVVNANRPQIEISNDIFQTVKEVLHEANCR